MGTISEKLTYLNETKELLKTSINNTGANITNNSFREYPTILNTRINKLKSKYETLEEASPKKEASGKNITIENAIDVPAHEIKLSKESTQAITNGKNKLSLQDGTYTSQDKNIVIKNGIIHFEGDSASTSINYYIPLLNNITLTTNKTYTLSVRADNDSVISNANVAIRLLTTNYASDSNSFGNTWKAIGTTKITTITATLSSDTTYTYAYLYINPNLTNQNFNLYWQLEEGETSTDYESYTNGPSPNPSYPQEIKTVTGYRNLFDINTPTGYYPQNHLKYEIENNSITLEAIGTTGAQSATYVFDGFDDTKNYTLSFKAKKLVAGEGSYARIQITIYGSNDGTDFTTIKTISENTPIVNQEYSLNWTVSGYKYYRFLIYNDASNPVQLGEKTQYYDILFTEGDNILPYVPYGTNWIYKKIVGKNMFDVNEFESKLVTGKILNDNGVEISDNTSTYSKYLIPVKANTVYYRKGAWQRMYVYDINKNLITRGSGVTGFDSSFTIEQDGYIGFQISNSYWSSSKGQDQLEIGSQATSYEAYKENIITLPLRDNEIIGIDDYKDKYIIDKNGHCWLNKKLKRITLNGTENYAYYANERWNVRLSLSDMEVATNTVWKMSTGIMSTHFKKYYWGDSSVNANGRITTLNTFKWISFGMSSITTLAEWKQWAEENTPDVIYPLEESDLIDLEYNVDADLFKGTNNIIAYDDMDINITYIENISDIFSTLATPSSNNGGGE